MRRVGSKAFPKCLTSIDFWPNLLAKAFSQSEVEWSHAPQNASLLKRYVHLTAVTLSDCKSLLQMTFNCSISFLGFFKRNDIQDSFTIGMAIDEFFVLATPQANRAMSLNGIRNQKFSKVLMTKVISERTPGSISSSDSSRNSTCKNTQKVTPKLQNTCD